MKVGEVRVTLLEDDLFMFKALLTLQIENLNNSINQQNSESIKSSLNAILVQYQSALTRTEKIIKTL